MKYLVYLDLDSEHKSIVSTENVCVQYHLE